MVGFLSWKQETNGSNSAEGKLFAIPVRVELLKKKNGQGVQLTIDNNDDCIKESVLICVCVCVCSF